MSPLEAMRGATPEEIQEWAEKKPKGSVPRKATSNDQFFQEVQELIASSTVAFLKYRGRRAWREASVAAVLLRNRFYKLGEKVHITIESDRDDNVALMKIGMLQEQQELEES